MAPDGAGGGGALVPPLEDWIKRLNGADKKDRKAIVEELAKALDVKIGDAYKTLKEAGWDPKNNDKTFINNGSPPAAGERPMAGESPAPDTSQASVDTQPGSSANTEGPAVGGITVALRHTTPYPHYRRAGLLLTNRWKSYAVTAEQLGVLKKDAWVEFQESAGPDKT